VVLYFRSSSALFHRNVFNCCFHILIDNLFLQWSNVSISVSPVNISVGGGGFLDAFVRISYTYIVLKFQ
jgi:hypothetical protein